MPVTVQRAVADVAYTDIVIVPSMVLGPEGWERGAPPELVAWLSAMQPAGALLCSACSGILLTRRDGPASTAWRPPSTSATPGQFRAAFPEVPIHPDEVLVVSGTAEELVTSGASMTWHDLVLYLIARHVGAAAAQEVARFFALQWHQDGLAPFIRSSRGGRTTATRPSAPRRTGWRPLPGGRPGRAR